MEGGRGAVCASDGGEVEWLDLRETEVGFGNVPPG
jgi:hypothetical protein